jgi:hypothetical protein
MRLFVRPVHSPFPKIGPGVMLLLYFLSLMAGFYLALNQGPAPENYLMDPIFCHHGFLFFYGFLALSFILHKIDFSRKADLACTFLKYACLVYSVLFFGRVFQTFYFNRSRQLFLDYLGESPGYTSWVIMAISLETVLTIFLLINLSRRRDRPALKFADSCQAD